MSTKIKETTETKTSTETATRKVTIFSTQSNTSQTIETSASTWGELKKELPASAASTRAVVRETRNTLESGGAQLPNQDFTLFMYPERVKSGATVKVHKLPESDWDTEVKEVTLNKLGEYKQEYASIMDKLTGDAVPIKKISPEEAVLAEEALQLEKELLF